MFLASTNTAVMAPLTVKASALRGTPTKYVALPQANKTLAGLPEYALLLLDRHHVLTGMRQVLLLAIVTRERCS